MWRGSFLDRLGDLLFPPQCVGCHQPGQLFCAACAASLAPQQSVVLDCELWALGAYEGVLSRALSAVKHRGQTALASHLAERLAQDCARRWESAPPQRVLGLPSSRSGRRYRGFSLPSLLQEAVVRRTGWSPLESELAACFLAAPSSSRGLGLQQRLARAASSGLGELEGSGQGRLLLLDDVVTTGTTMAQAIRTARALGFDPVCCGAVALASAQA